MRSTFDCLAATVEAANRSCSVVHLTLTVRCSYSHNSYRRDSSADNRRLLVHCSDELTFSPDSTPYRNRSNCLICSCSLRSVPCLRARPDVHYRRSDHRWSDRFRYFRRCDYCNVYASLLRSRSNVSDVASNV